MYSILRSLMFRLPAETSHDLALDMIGAAGRLGLARRLLRPVAPQPVEVMGLKFANPVGLAAGLDKNAVAVDGLGAMGFGFIEVGTVTPRPQPGNPRPRMFRLPQAQAIINRMGFNNQGVDALLERLQGVDYDGVLGINIGKNAVTPVENAVDDYLTCLRKVYAYADYVTLNLSSPNTPGLRTLQYGDALKALLEPIKQAQLQLQQEHGRYVPLALKIAPDMNDEELRLVAHTLLEQGMDAVIATSFDIGVAHHGGYAEYARVPAAWVVPLPAGLDLFEAMALGTAGFTAALGVVRMEDNGLAPANGPVLVTGPPGASAGWPSTCSPGWAITSLR